ncbi:hypothetical protein Cni_G21608 [Canna indica]|uniref:MYND-type domain-containing protein n=1 Tax=Canna indica TaxID=4628 RepID=A0AAQ3QLU2_9LILI|nr:hypothetical protein Cni_G21608 [Canna indica]
MRTRSGLRYPQLQSSDDDACWKRKQWLPAGVEEEACCRWIGKEIIRGKRRRRLPVDDDEVVLWEHCEEEERPDLFEELPEDLVVLILGKLSASADCPADLVSVIMTCKRLNRSGLDPVVLAKASPASITIRFENWSESAHEFLKKCADAGNLEALYSLGMIRFYCLENRQGGIALMARAALRSHAAALYSLAVIQFNGSGGSKDSKDLRAGVALCARAATLGHIDALRELGHCLQDGYGIRQNVPAGRRFLFQANSREAAAFVEDHQMLCDLMNSSCALLSDYGCNVPPTEPHPANRFLLEWFASKGTREKGLRLCSHSGCGRPETRQHEFRRCSVCGRVNYCSRACQALHWKMAHKDNCFPLAVAAPQWADAEAGGAVQEAINQ